MQNKTSYGTDKCSKAIYEHIREYASKISKKRILDIGCGTGNYTSLFAINNNNVIGLDINDFRKEKYKKKFKFTKYKGNEFPFRKNSFDVIVSFDVIEHVEDDEGFIQEMYRVLKKGGECLFTTPNRLRLSNFIKIIIGKKPQYPLTLSEDGDLGELIHIREYTKRDLYALYTSRGINNVRIEPFWFGLRGNVNIGTNKAIIPLLSQYWLIYSKKI